jgi:VIT1/CCC1 family predicted Fe2+/Mn2+ transporter
MIKVLFMIVIIGSINIWSIYGSLFMGLLVDITTFAVVSGAVGAGLNNKVIIIIIIGFANLLADGFAMSVGAYLSAKSVKDNYNKHKQIEYWEVDNLPEREEVEDVYHSKGFEGSIYNKLSILL